MRRIRTLCAGTITLLALCGCKNTLNAVGDTTEGAVRGTGTIVKGVGEGVGHIGKGIGKDLDGDKTAGDAPKE